MNYEFSAHKQPYQAKPTKTEAARISNGLEHVYVESIKGFIEDIQQGIS